MVDKMNTQMQTFNSIIQTIGSAETNDQEINTKKELAELGQYLNGEKSTEFKERFGVDLNATMMEKLKQVYNHAKTVIDNLTKNSNHNEDVEQTTEPPFQPAVAAKTDKNDKTDGYAEEDVPEPDPNPNKPLTPNQPKNDKTDGYAEEDVPEPDPNSNKPLTPDHPKNNETKPESGDEQVRNPDPNKNENKGKKIIGPNGKMCILKPNGDIYDIMTNRKVGHRDISN